MERQLKIKKTDIESVKKISEQLNCHLITAEILLNRNISCLEEAKTFLKPSLNNLRPPFLIKDMDKAIERIIKAIYQNEKILIFGDYDVDGITGTIIFYEFLQYVGADVSYYIPHRIDEGYSLQKRHISDYAVPKGFKLIITVDCGASSYDAADYAFESGIDLIISDHHHIENIPDAYAVIDPKRKDCNSGFTHLSGVGVAFFILVCLRKRLREIGFWNKLCEPNLKNFLDLTALGTIADIVPLIAENRIIAKTGLEVINSGNRIGIKALTQVSGINNRLIDAHDIAYRLAPRLNAAGRIGHAHLALELLTTKNYETAINIAKQLNAMNAKRQEMEKEIFNSIVSYLEKNKNLLNKKSIVLANDTWHEGIIGIIASRLVERYYRPVILISTRSGSGKGSGRSIAGINLYNALSLCSKHMEGFGGHSLAGGLKIKPENIDAFIQDFENTIESISKPQDFIKIINIDYELNFDIISEQLINELETLTPFGEGNDEPLFMAKNINVITSSIVGENHRKMILSQESKNVSINAIHFNIDRCIKQNQSSYNQIIFKLQWNRWNGKKSPQIIIEEI